MTRPLIEVYAPEFVDGEWMAAAQVNLDDGPIRVFATAPGALVARFLARIQALVAVRELRQIPGGEVGAAGAERELAGRAAAGELLRRAREGDDGAGARLGRIFALAAQGHPGALEAAAWVRAAERGGEVGACGVGCANCNGAPGALSLRDLDRIERLRALRAVRRGARFVRRAA